MGMGLRLRSVIGTGGGWLNDPQFDVCQGVQENTADAVLCILDRPRLTPRHLFYSTCYRISAAEGKLHDDGGPQTSPTSTIPVTLRILVSCGSYPIVPTDGLIGDGLVGGHLA